MRAHPSAFAVIVSGPSGVGKNSICSAVLACEPRAKSCVTTTTRPPRNGEVDGRDYHFVSDAAFQTLVDGGEFVEWAEVYGARYGATVAAVERALDGAGVMLLDVDVQGAASWKAALGHRCVTVFVLPPSIETLIQRLTGRQTEAASAIARRRANVTRELTRARDYDYVMVNHDVPQAARDLQDIIRAERLRPWRMAEVIDGLTVGLKDENP
jgi:guanylate kinase